MADHRTDVDASRRDEPKELFHVPVFGPSDVARRIVAALFFVRRVVAAGPVRARHDDVDLLHVHEVAREVHLDRAHDDDLPTLATDAERQIDRRRRLRGGRHDDAVRAASFREGIDATLRLIGRRERMVGAELFRHLDAVGTEIQPDDDGALRAGDLRDELADHAQSDHGDDVTDADAGEPDAVHGNGAERREAGLLERHLVGDAGDEQSARGDGLGVARALAAVGDPRPDIQIGHGRMLVDENPRPGVPEGAVFLELGRYLGRHADGTGDLHRVEDLLDVRRILGDAAKESLGMDAGGLGPRADQRAHRPNEHVVRRRDRVRHLVHHHLLQSLPKHLLHVVSEISICVRNVIVALPAERWPIATPDAPARCRRRARHRAPPAR